MGGGEEKDKANSGLSIPEKTAECSICPKLSDVVQSGGCRQREAGCQGQHRNERRGVGGQSALPTGAVRDDE